MATHYSILAWRIPMDRGTWWATVHGVAKSQTQLSDFTFTFQYFWPKHLELQIVTWRKLWKDKFGGGGDGEQELSKFEMPSICWK